MRGKKTFYEFLYFIINILIKRINYLFSFFIKVIDEREMELVTSIHITIELARKKMIESVMQFGVNDKKTILLSQELDQLIIYYQNQQIRSCSRECEKYGTLNS